MVFPSGRKVKIIRVQEVETKDTAGRLDRALLLEYETRFKVTDNDAMRKEVDEIWHWLKVDVQHRELTEAIIEIVESFAASSEQKVKRAQLDIKRQPDGSWKRSSVHFR